MSISTDWMGVGNCREWPPCRGWGTLCLGGAPTLYLMSPLLPHPFLLPPASDYIIKEKTVLLQKKDSEGFGFVLRGAKGECWPGRGRESLSDPRSRACIGRMEKEKGPPTHTKTLSPPIAPPWGAGPSAPVSPL